MLFPYFGVLAQPCPSWKLGLDEKKKEKKFHQQNHLIPPSLLVS